MNSEHGGDNQKILFDKSNINNDKFVNSRENFNYRGEEKRDYWIMYFSESITTTFLYISSYSIGLYIFYLLIKIAYYFVSTIRFFNWARKQKLVLIKGGSGSGKKILLNFLNENIKNKKNNVFSYLGFFNQKKSYDINNKVWEDNYFSLIKENDKKINCFLINELEDSPLNLEEKIDETKQKIALNISLSNHSGNIFWIAFLSNNGFLWNNLSSRSNAVIECIRVESLNFKYTKIYFLTFLINYDQKESPKKWTILIGQKSIDNYKNTWLNSFLEKYKSLEV